MSLSSVINLPTALSTNWNAPVPKNGIITGYTVYCNTSASQAYPEQVIGPNIPTIRSVVNGTALSVTFNTGLNPYTQYSCYLTANTSAGEGSPSVIITARTVEGGKFRLLMFKDNFIGKYEFVTHNTWGPLHFVSTTKPYRFIVVIDHVSFLNGHVY